MEWHLHFLLFAAAAVIPVGLITILVVTAIKMALGM
jgi:hypothetical protein